LVDRNIFTKVSGGGYDQHAVGSSNKAPLFACVVSAGPPPIAADYISVHLSSEMGYSADHNRCRST